jgi:threonine dehydrogenase-like Zn-dependent dehydrogenase
VRSDKPRDSVIEKARPGDPGKERAVMQGVILPGQERVEFERFDLREPGRGQALVRMKASGLCGSDLRVIYHEYKGSGAERCQNVIAGHEPAGQVEVVRPGVSDFEVGDRVVVYHIAGCGQFEECRKGFMRKRLHPEATMTHSFLLSEAKQTYEIFDAGKKGKVAISWEDK